MSRHALQRRGFVALGALALAGGSLTSLPTASADTGVQSTYVVLYTAGAKSAGAQQAVESAGGTLVANYAEIGVVIARSSQTGFAAAMSGKPGVDSAVSTGGFGVKSPDISAGTAQAADALATWGDSLSGQQWNMRQLYGDRKSVV